MEKKKNYKKLQKNKNLKYKKGKTKGIGAFGKVKEAIHQFTGELVAIKILEKDKIIDISDVERIQREIHILKLIRHPTVIQIYEIIETPTHIFLVMEYCSKGELFEYIVEQQRLKETEASKFFQEIIAGIEYLHKLQVVHRDLKPENLLLDHNKCIKIVDFGLSNTYKKNELLKTACGSPCYAAPEMIAGKKYSCPQVDIWSSGVILFALICGYLPFEDDSTSALYKKILNGDYQIPSFVTFDAKDLLQKILNIDPKKRINFEEIKMHKFFNLNKREYQIPPGIIIGFNQIPIDQEIIKQLEAELGLEKESVVQSLDANKLNHLTTSYFLLLKKFVRNGGVSKADLNSKSFDLSLIEPKKYNSQNKGKFLYLTVQVVGKEENESQKTIKSNNITNNNQRQIIFKCF
ncbi:protein kinase domain protein [Ichthyophthirius multifiliis]|uniref:Protein kinase domain protein n=1 Tax=Ichthyophthirius multifiliis TaxID=5932 RepID=G0QLA3_ICHMU|nr:protein kinase domain protein [Ichthyophthirius multifiliis]EGR34004.1 protein kinase domain protein [Ichthyophthirius multifiliis]|eukprot:XP_004039308.1 protein kinase domain protein [Ichthyophthirius multifiliis]